MARLASVSMTPEEAQAILAGYEDRVSIAAINDPNSVVLSGSTSAIEDIIVRCDKRGFATRPLRVDYAFHSPQMDVFERELVERLVRVDTRRATLAMYSTVLADCVDGKELDVRYWGRNVRQTVDFAGAVVAAIRDGYQLFLEVGPHPVLTSNIQQCMVAKKVDGAVGFTMRRSHDQRRTLLDAVGTLYTRGCLPEWARIVPSGGKTVPLPTYPWQKERYWVELGPQKTLGDTKGHQTSRYAAGRDSFFSLEWRKAATTRSDVETKQPKSGAWLIFADSSGMADSLIALLCAQGESYIRVQASDHYEQITPNSYHINPRNSTHYEMLLRDAFRKGSPCRGIVHAFGLDATAWTNTTVETLCDDQWLCSVSALFLTQAILKHAWRDIPKQWLITRGMQMLDVHPTSHAIAQASLWGMGPTIFIEHPELACTLVDLPANASTDDASALLAELAHDDTEERVAIRDGLRFVARLAHASLDAFGPPTAPNIRDHATYLITGGLGGLGLKAAKWLVAHGARHMVLVGRNAPSTQAQAEISEMEQAGAQVLVLQRDIAIKAEVAAIFEEMDRAGRPLGGILHAAGIVADGTLLQMSDEQFTRVFPAKIAGAWNLHELTLDRPLDFFVMFSSTASLLGSPGQINYAAANSFMDALARMRRALGLPGTSIHWGPFSDVGMAVRNDGRTQQLASRGLEALSPEAGLNALELLLGQTVSEMAVVRIDHRRWFDVLPHTAASPFWSEIRNDPQDGQPSTAAETRRFRTVFENSSQVERARLLDQLVREELGRVLHMEPSRIAADAPFKELGADSLMSLEVKNRLERNLDLRLPATLLYTFSTMKALTTHLLHELTSMIAPANVVAVDEKPIAAPSPVEVPAHEDELLADFEETMRLVKGFKP